MPNPCFMLYTALQFWSPYCISILDLGPLFMIHQSMGWFRGNPECCVLLIWFIVNFAYMPSLSLRYKFHMENYQTHTWYLRNSRTQYFLLNEWVLLFSLSLFMLVEHNLIFTGFFLIRPIRHRLLNSLLFSAVSSNKEYYSITGDSLYNETEVFLCSTWIIIILFLSSVLFS